MNDLDGIGQPNIEDSNCLITRVAYDIGSGTTKVAAATVDVCRNEIKELYLFDYESVPYKRDLAGSTNNNFSDLVRDMGLQVMENFKAMAKETVPDKAAQHCGVATAAFRGADNAADFIKRISTELNIPVSILAQEDEGKLAYLGALANCEIPNLVEPIVWDIGGGSMQFTHRAENSDEYSVLGSELASETFLLAFKEKVLGNRDSFYPISNEEAAKGIELAKSCLPHDGPAHTEILDKIQQQSDIIAVGSVHNLSIKAIVDKVTDQNHEFITKEHLLKAISHLVEQPQECVKTIKGGELFVENQISDLILVFSAMEHYNIDRIIPLPTSNAEGLLFFGCDDLNLHL